MGKIDEANEKAVEKINKSTPMLTGLYEAQDVIPGMDSKTILNAGPPVEWDRMSGPQRGAVIGASMFEGLADSPEEAEEMAKNGEIKFDPCHDHDSVGPMAGIISPSMSVYEIESDEYGHKSYSNLNEGLGDVLRYGSYSQETLDRLDFMENTMAPVLKEAIDEAAPMNQKEIVQQALHMGDECHARNVATTHIFIKKMAPYIAETSFSNDVKSEVFEFMGDNDLTYLNPLMASAKNMLDAGHGVEYSTVVTAMARNGTDFGIRVSGLPDQWFAAKAPKPDTLYFPGYEEGDEGGDIGDSTITETMGLGGFASATAPSVVKVVGGSVDDAIEHTKEMREITVTEHSSFSMPFMDFKGTSLGIDVRKVIDTGIQPFINTGVAHHEPGEGSVGFGLVRAPMECFTQAIKAFKKKYK